MKTFNDESEICTSENFFSLYFGYTGKLLYLELVRTEEKIRGIPGFENLKFEFVTIKTPKHVVLFHIENKLT